jgi:DNA-binding transcriptional ArsR family regulator
LGKYAFLSLFSNNVFILTVQSPVAIRGDVKWWCAMIIKDPEVAKLFADETRRRILHLLSHNEMSITDLAKTLDKTHSSIQHHLVLLMDAGLVKQTREEKVRNMVQPFFKATSHKFMISYSLSEILAKDDGYSMWRDDLLRSIYSGLATFGVGVSEDFRGRVLELIDICYEREQKALEEALEQQRDPGELEKSVQIPLMRLMTQLKLVQDAEHTAAIHELCKLIGP